MSDDETLAIADPSLLDWYASGSEDIHAFNRACIAFAHAIAAKERGACAILAHDWPAPLEGRVPLEIAAAIRARNHDA